MADYANRRRHAAFRELVAVQLQLAGLDAAAAPLTQRRPSEAFALPEAELTASDVQLPGWHIKASAAMTTERIGPMLDAAQQESELAGDGYRPVVVMHRRGTPSEGALVTMSLATFRSLAAELARTHDGATA